MKIVSWNVNGLRAIHRKGFLRFMSSHDFDIICLQEIKARPDQLGKELINPYGYHSYFNPAQKPGYSGVAVYASMKPGGTGKGFGIPKFDDEGRVVWLDFREFILFNVYMPNGGRSQQRLDYKMDFYYTFLDNLKNLLAKGKKIILTGDINTAHRPIDLARPKQNEKNTGFLPQEREWIDQLLSSGFIDTFRMYNSQPGQYTWWDYKTRSRDRNVGWRLDYFFCSNNLEHKVKDSYIMQHIEGSDHCPVVLELDYQFQKLA